jgi:hypothetical protein
MQNLIENRIRQLFSAVKADGVESAIANCIFSENGLAKIGPTAF